MYQGLVGGLSPIVYKSIFSSLYVGWVNQLCSFIFLTRNWNTDKNYVKRILSYYTHSGCNYQILLFPEGTNLTARTAVRNI